MTNVKVGTILWRFLDDTGMEHRFKIPNSFYVQDGGCRLLSPQHWAKAVNDKGPMQHGTQKITTVDDVTLEWKQRQFKRTVPLGKSDNVATMDLAPGYDKYRAFCAVIGDSVGTDDAPVTCQPTVVSDGESDGDDDDDDAVRGQIGDPLWRFNAVRRRTQREKLRPHFPRDHTPPDTWETGPNSLFSLNGPVNVPNIIVDEEDRMPHNQAAEFLRHHHNFNHLPFAKLKEMAKVGIIPKKFATTPSPVCTACMYAKAAKRPWRQKSILNLDEPYKPTQPGELISVDQMSSSTLGLIAQMVGRLTTQCYTCATVYVDHFQN